jgi:hypothetical protein
MEEAMRIIACVCVLLVAVSCEQGSKGDAGGDFATPAAAVQTFFKAAASGDRDLLSRCFSSKCEGEFKKVIDKTVRDSELEDLKKMFAGAKITKTDNKSGDPNRVTVHVSLTLKDRPKESLFMVKEAGGWKIRGF